MASETSGSLKEKICSERRLALSSVTLYCGPCLLTDDTLMVNDLLEFTNSFLLELPEAGEIEIESEKEVFLLTGSRMKFEPPLRIKKKERKIKIKAYHDKFGIITHENIDTCGRKSYQVERYHLKGKGKVTLRTSEGNGELLVILEGEAEPLVPVVMTYVEQVALNENML